MKQDMRGRCVGPMRGLAVAGLALLVSACSTTTRGPDEIGSYLPWLIAVAEPAAPAIGMAISAVQWRQGRLQSSAGALPEIRRRMRPLDVFLFSNKHRLAGHTGAGLFGHSAVYLGSAAPSVTSGSGLTAAAPIASSPQPRPVPPPESVR